MILPRGAVHAVCWDGKEATRMRVTEGDFRAPAYLLIRADRSHAFTALEPETDAVCVFALRDAAGHVTTDRAQDWDLRCAQ